MNVNYRFLDTGPTRFYFSKSFNVGKFLRMGLVLKEDGRAAKFSSVFFSQKAQKYAEGKICKMFCALLCFLREILELIHLHHQPTKPHIHHGLLLTARDIKIPFAISIVINPFKTLVNRKRECDFNIFRFFSSDRQRCF